MSDDTFIREVNEEIRQERVRRVWQRFGALIVAVVVLAVAGTIAFVVWDRYQASRAAADGDRYFQAVDLAASGDHDGAIGAFEALAEDGVGSYPHLARLRIAGTMEEAGEHAAAVEVLDTVIDSSAPQALRDVAAIRAGYILVDHGTSDDVRARVERLTGEAQAMRHQAREALGLSLWREGEGEAARPLFQQITEDLSAPSGISQRAYLMLDVIDAGARMPDPATAPATPEAPVSEPVAPSLEGDLLPLDEPPVQGAPVDAPTAGPVDLPPAEASDDALTTPLAEQLDLPETDGQDEAEEQDPAAAPPTETTDEPAAGTQPPS